MASDAKPHILQAAAVPYRCRNGEPEFCLVTSIRSGKWGVPKGIIDPGETSVETALKEAEEEAGLCGQIEGEPLGQYEYRKWGTTLQVTVHLMRVVRADSDWHEAKLRDRIWCKAEKARRLIRSEQLPLLMEAQRRLAAQPPSS